MVRGGLALLLPGINIGGADEELLHLRLAGRVLHLVANEGRHRGALLVRLVLPAHLRGRRVGAHKVLTANAGLDAVCVAQAVVEVGVVAVLRGLVACSALSRLAMRSHMHLRNVALRPSAA